MNKKKMSKKKARSTTVMAEEPIAPAPEDGMAEQPVDIVIPELEEYAQVAEW